MKVNYTPYIFGLLFVIGLTAMVNYYYKTPWEAGLPSEFAEKRVREVLMDTSERSWAKVYHNSTLIATAETAVKIAEPILFEVYGKERILSERPYGVHKIGGYWFISGSVPRLSDGGGFEIILDARDAKVMSIVHYR
ncbi:NTF2 fold immunity protein [Chryseolinea serpens]|uniref:NTF2 fold immunity protein n=1 Tax=Chryseolinea serpens TaxID=947013 RepID=A0A1M5WDL6_9BACT|nr:NTF2 fold immunity protein [Chryseolinea serpens]SHH85586.1 NTF2 fold immunity protein [Chryseolinea serpens]